MTKYKSAYKVKNYTPKVVKKGERNFKLLHNPRPYSIGEFLNLSDSGKGKAIGLNYDNYKDYPTMREKELQFRIIKLEKLKYHFICKRLYTEDYVGGVVPFYFFYFLTPKLIDIFPFELITEKLGYCHSCSYFQGERKLHFKCKAKHNNSKVIRPFGKCRANNGKPNVLSWERCYNWYPDNIFNKIIHQEINKVLSNSDYSKKDYQEDIENAPLNIMFRKYIDPQVISIWEETRS